MLDVKRLRVLKEVAACGSFSAAADSLSYTQSAVSQQIAALERETGRKLVERGSKGIRLTDAGEALVRHTEAILARLAEAEAELDAIAGLRGGRVRMSTFASAGASIVPPAIATFRERYPGVEIELSLLEPMEGIDGLRAGEIDIALLVEPGFGPVPEGSIERVHLLDDEMYVALPLSHPLAAKRTLKLGDLCEDAWMLGGRTTCPDTGVFLRACHAAGFEPKLAFENDDYNAIQGLVAAGVGVALIPQLALVNVREDIVVRALAGRPPVRQVVAGVTPAGRRAPATVAMLEVLQESSASWASTPQPALAAVS